MSCKGFGKSLCSTLESLRIGNGNTRSASIINNNCFYLLGTHDGAQAATASTADVAFRIGKGNVGCRKPHFSCRTNYGDADFGAVFLLQDFNGIVVAHAHGFRGSFINGHTICRDIDDEKLVLCWNSLERKCFDAHSGHLLTKGAAPVLLSLMPPVSGLLAPQESRPELAALVPERKPGAKISLLFFPKG